MFNELGEWKNKLRPNFIPMMSTFDEMLKLRFIKKSWEAKRIAVRFVLRTITAKLTGKHYVTAGAALQGRMFQAALNVGVEFRTDAAVSELIVDGDAVKGVVAMIGGKPRRFAARLGVLVNAGGFAHNQKMRDQYQPCAAR